MNQPNFSPPTPRTRAQKLSREAFNTVLHDDVVSAEKLEMVLRGDAVAYHIHGLMDRDVCDQVTNNFVHSPHKTTYKVTPLIESIDSSLFTIGDRAKYLAQDYKTPTVYDGTRNYFAETTQALKEQFADAGINYRLVREGGNEAFASIFRRWGSAGSDEDGYAARVHDDEDQVLHQLQEGFETQTTYEEDEDPDPRWQVSANYYHSVAQHGGDLEIWNIAPPHSFFQRYEDTEHEHGYGFHPDIVDGHDTKVLTPAQGDVIMFNSKLMHAVRGTSGAGIRLSAATLSGISNEDGEQMVARHPELREEYEAVARTGRRTVKDVQTILYWS